MHLYEWASEEDSGVHLELKRQNLTQNVFEDESIIKNEKQMFGGFICQKNIWSERLKSHDRDPHHWLVH